MPWNEVDVREQRIRFVIVASLPGANLQQLCLEFGISRPTGYLWIKRFEQTGSASGLCEVSRRPLHVFRETSPELAERVEQLRREFGWGARKLQVLLAREGTALPVITIGRILKRRGLIDPRDASSPALQRFERAHPNELWQMDGKGEYGLAAGGYCYPLSILDDHSRYSIALDPLQHFRGETVRPCLVRAFLEYGLPLAMLMDHGTVWWSNTNGYGLTKLSVELIEQGIELIFGRVYHPQTQGKVERFNRTVADGVRHHGRPQTWEPWPALLERIRTEYNHVRPHEALHMQTPAAVYVPSTRLYQVVPRLWVYPVGSDVRELNSQGCLPGVGGTRPFVCQALAGKQVRVEELPNGNLVVSYRHMYVREIWVKERRSKPFTMLTAGNGGVA